MAQLNRHRLITGISGSGKTFLAAHFARVEARRKIIYAPAFGFEDASNAAVYHDKAEFMRAVYKASDVDIYIDEADTVLPNKIAVQDLWIMQRGRHYGMAVTLITQRPALLSVTARDQCVEAFMFQLNPKDYAAVLDIYGVGDCAPTDLPMQEFIHLRRGRENNTMARWRVEVRKRRRAA